VHDLIIASMRFAAHCLAVAALLLPSSAGAQTQPAVIRIEMSEFAFRPAALTLTAGRPVRLVVVNEGQIAHQFEAAYLRALPLQLVGDALHAEIPGLEFLRVNPGGTARLEFVPWRKGRFVFFCGIEGHREAGMQGFVQVR